MNAARLIKKYGQPIKFSYVTDRVRNIETGGFDDGVSVLVDGFGCPFAYEAKEIDGTLIQATDIKLMTYADTKPQKDWKCELSEATYTVKSVTTMKKAGADIAYICQLRV
jgi:hypothetical protein